MAAVFPAVYIPFRALTHRDCGNLLVAGKTMAMSFHANAASRLHPTEWSSGVAAGAAAALMAQNGWDSADMLENVKLLQQTVTAAPLKQPLQWTFP